MAVNKTAFLVGALAGGSVAVIDVGLLTVNRLDASCALPTSIPATSGTPPDSNPLPLIVMR